MTSLNVCTCEFDQYFLLLLLGWYGDLWWETIPNDGFECTIEDMETVLSYSLAAVQYPIFSETEQSDLGVVSSNNIITLNALQ